MPATKSSGDSGVVNLTNIEQHHSGSGDNVRDKFYIQIKSLAPSDLLAPMEMVFESLRKNDRATAKIQMSLLKAMAQREPEASALVEVISIYGGLVDTEEHSAAWGAVSRIASSTQNEIVKDVCVAALLRLARRTEREEAAKEYYLAEEKQGPYSQEEFLRFYADAHQLEVLSRKLILSEGELTGIAEGALRLQLKDLAVRTSQRLCDEFSSYNARVLRTLSIAAAFDENVAVTHLWLSTPEVKQRVDDLAAQVVELIDLSKGADTRLYNMACPIFETYQGLAPIALVGSLKKYIKQFEALHPTTASIIKTTNRDLSDLPEWRLLLQDAGRDPQKRLEWCKRFLSAASCTLENVIPFFHLATPAQIREWLSKKSPIDDATDLELAFVRLLGSSFQNAGLDDDKIQRHDLAEQADHFLNEYGGKVSEIAPGRVFELAEKLYDAGLPHKAICFTSLLVPDHSLWLSPFVSTHLRCLLEAQQYKSFDKVVGRVVGAEKSLALMILRSLKAERLGDINSALKISDEMIALAPEVQHCWYRGCYLRSRYRSETEQLEFQERIPDSVLERHSRDAVAILFFLARAGNFPRAEPRWVEWFIKDPRGISEDLVNCHFGLSFSGKRRDQFDVSFTLEQCIAAYQFEQSGSTVIRLVVDDHLEPTECTLKASSQLAEFLASLSPNGSGQLGMVKYEAVERLAPYVACLRLALQLRHVHNDGSDCFAMLKMPSDAEQFVPFLEETFGQAGIGNNNQQLSKADNLPLYIRGHALSPSNSFKGALNCWTDINIPKSLLFDKGEVAPKSIVMDAYGIGYLAVTDLAQRILDIGISIVLPQATKEALNQWIEQISDANYMTLGLTEEGRLFRTTAEDIQARDGHVLKALRLILDNSSIVHPLLHDAALDIYAIRDGVDATVYDAMQLSLSNNIPWFCMDWAFASIHQSNQHAIVNVHEVIMQATAIAPYDFERKRHGLLLYAIGALPLPLSFIDLQRIAANPNNLAGFILFKIIKNHGRQIFFDDERAIILLDLLLMMLNSQFHSGGSFRSMSPRYSPIRNYTEHVFNHGIRLFLSVYETEGVESRLAKAIAHMAMRVPYYQEFLQFIDGYFVRFIRGNFMDIEEIGKKSALLIADMMKEHSE